MLRGDGTDGRRRHLHYLISMQSEFRERKVCGCGQNHLHSGRQALEEQFFEEMFIEGGGSVP